MRRRIRLRRLPSPERQRNNSSLCVGIVHRHAPTHRFHKHPNQSQTDATAWDPGTVAAATETLEHSLTLRLWDPRTVVTNTHDNPFCIDAEADLHR